MEKNNKEVRFNIDKIEPGKDAEIITIGPKSDLQRIILNYGDEYGNEYQTVAIISFKERKVLRQEFKKTKIVKDIGDDAPKLEIDEDSIDWNTIECNKSEE